MSIAEWRQVQELFGRVASQEKAFLAMKQLYDEQAIRLTEVEIQLEQQRAQLAGLRSLPNGSNAVRNR